MKIYDESNQFICDSEKDEEKYLELSKTGKFNIKQNLIKHHDAIIATETQSVYKPSIIYFDDGTSQKVEENDPHIKYNEKNIPIWHKLEGDKHSYFGMDIVQEIVQEGSPAIPAWDETEDILIYTPFTEDEILAQKKDQEIQEFLDHATDYYKFIKEAGANTAEQLNKIEEMQNHLNELNMATAELIEEDVSVKDPSYIKLNDTIDSLSQNINTTVLVLAEMIGVE